MAQRAKLDYVSRSSRGWYMFLRGFFWVVFHTLWPLRVEGAKNVPRTGAAVIVSNHLSLVDPFVVGYAANRLVCFMAKEELFRTPVLGFLIRQVGAFPVDRSRRDPSAMRTALQVLRDGQLLGMFPEGTRSTTGELQEFRSGAVRLAARTHAKIVPVAVRRTDRALPPKKWFRPARIGITFGEPFEVAELYERNDKGEALQQALVHLRDVIHALQEPEEVGGRASR